MQRLAQQQQSDHNQQSQLIDVINAVVPEAADSCSEIPDVPARLWDRWDLARVFCKHPDTVHRWEQDGWITAVRKPSGRIQGYPAEQVVAVAARLFSKFPNSTFDETEAERLQLQPLLRWTKAAVQSVRAFKAAGNEAILDVINLMALAEERVGMGNVQNLSDDDLADHRPAARAQLRARLRDPYARHILLRAWRESGAVVRVNKIKSAAKTPNEQHT